MACAHSLQRPGPTFTTLLQPLLLSCTAKAGGGLSGRSRRLRCWMVQSRPRHPLPRPTDITSPHSPPLCNRAQDTGCGAPAGPSHAPYLPPLHHQQLHELPFKVSQAGDMWACAESRGRVAGHLSGALTSYRAAFPVNSKAESLNMKKWPSSGIYLFASKFYWLLCVSLLTLPWALGTKSWPCL